MAKRITELNHEEALAFLMKPEQYCTTELPEYFDFSGVLDFCEKKLKGHKLQDFIASTAPNTLSGVNLEILTNKDGKYGVRTISLSNPFLYTALANTICEKDAWAKVLECFKKFEVSNLTACAIPVVKEDSDREPFHKSTTILNWWNQMEQLPIELSLKYRYMFLTDITNCFGQITPQDIDRAFGRKGTKFETTENVELAKEINTILSDMQGGRNIGIPQGSTLFALIAEVVLGYADLLLDKAIKDADIKEEYTILRYVDDYRIFCNDRNTLEEISFLLQHVMETLNFRMNPSKTRISDCIIADSVKPDKAFYIFNTPIFSKKGVDFDGFQKHLFYIFEFGRKFPNSGQMKVMLADFSRRLEQRLIGKAVKSLGEEVLLGIEEDDYAGNQNTGLFKDLKTYGGKKKSGVRLLEKLGPLVATATQIAADNVSVAHYALRIVSQLLDTAGAETKAELINLVYGKLRSQHNSAYLQIWLQNITYGIDRPEENRYDMPLCILVDNPDVELWNNEWLKPEFKDGFPTGSICNHELLSKAESVITFKEIRAYNEAIVVAEF